MVDSESDLALCENAVGVPSEMLSRWYMQTKRNSVPTEYGLFEFRHSFFFLTFFPFSFFVPLILFLPPLPPIKLLLGCSKGQSPSDTLCAGRGDFMKLTRTIRS